MIDFSTALINHPYAPPQEFSAPQTGQFKASTALFPSLALRYRAQDQATRALSRFAAGMQASNLQYLLSSACE